MASTDKNNSKSKKKADKELIANVIEVKEEDIPDNGSGFSSISKMKLNILKLSLKSLRQPLKK